MSSEFARIAQIEAVLRRESREVSLSIGDDCAVLAPSDKPRVWTVDTAVQGVHFSRDYMTLEHVAARAFSAAVSDVAAMGGRCVAALSALILPSTFSDPELQQLVVGLARASDEYGCPIVGGNLARGGELSLTTSVLGECPSAVITRSGARLGDGLFVTGTLGGAALGLCALSAGRAADPMFARGIEQFLRPRARLDCALDMAACATAAIDISDGLMQDLEHLCRASHAGARVEASALPLLEGFADAARALALDPIALALDGGEDYQILFSAPRTQVPPALARWIGTVTRERDGVHVLDAQGNERTRGRGFDHFADS
jgi:thiamine-monophosphate kinase